MSHRIPIVDTKININDFSVIKDPVALVSTIPLYLTAFSSDKGPEELMEVNGDRFFKLFGNRRSISYKKHGQTLIQAAASIDAGARLLCKRVVAPDASLANITLFAEVRIKPRLIIKTTQDDGGRVKIVYEDPNKPSSEQNEYLWDGEGRYIPKRIPDPQNRNSVLIRYYTQTDKGVKSIDSIKHKYENYQSDETTFPLFTITDNGRGVSGKSIRIDPTYYGRTLSSYQKHTISVIEDNEVIESVDFTFNPDIQVNGVNTGMNASVNRYMEQIKCHQYEDSVEALYDFIVENTMEEGADKKAYLEYLKSVDILFGRDKRNYVEQIQVVNSASSALNDLFKHEDETPSTGGEGTDTKPDTGETGGEGGVTEPPVDDANVEALKAVQAKLDNVNNKLDQAMKDLENAKAEAKVSKEEAAKVKDELMDEKQNSALKDIDNEKALNEVKTQLEKAKAESDKAKADLLAAKEEAILKDIENQEKLDEAKKRVSELENTKKALEETRNTLREVQEAKILAEAERDNAKSDAKAKAEQLKKLNEELKKVQSDLETEKGIEAEKDIENQKKLDAAYAKIAALEKEQAEAVEKEKAAEERRIKDNRDNLKKSLESAKLFMEADEYTKHPDDEVRKAFDKAYAKAIEIDADTVRPYSSNLISFVNSDLLNKQALVLTSYVPAEEPKPPKTDPEENKNKEANIKEIKSTINSAKTFKTVDAYTKATPGPVLDAFNTAFDKANEMINGDSHTAAEIKKANDTLATTMASLALAYSEAEPVAEEQDIQSLKNAIDSANVVKGSDDYRDSEEIAEKVEFEKALNDAIALRDKPETNKKKVNEATTDLLAKTNLVKEAAKTKAEELREAARKQKELEDKQKELEKKKTETVTGESEDTHTDSDSEGVTGEVQRGEEGTTDAHEESYPGVGPMVLMAMPPADLEPTAAKPVTRNVVNIMTPNGLPLESGDNGSFGDTPINRIEYETELFKFFNGDATNQIYDLDNYKIDAVIDANYPLNVKAAIEEFVIEHRNDCVYIRDYGLGINSMQEIEQMWIGFVHNYKVADYYLSYDIIDPYSNKQVPVTMTYTLAKKFVKHFKNGRHRPCAGMPYGFILEDAIPGTESFIPTRTKYTDQRERLTDKRINYAIYHDGKLVLETFYTSQETYSQLSFIHNVMNVQRLVKIIRTKCPTIRYSFMDGRELQNYKEEITYTIKEESANFAFIEVHFLMDETNMIDKQVHVVVEVACREFQQSELFDINIINVNAGKKKVI